jgi:very-short-patch-repair endonuclease
VSEAHPPLPNPSPARGVGLNSSPLAGEEGARREAVGRRGGAQSLLHLAKRMRHAPTEAERKLWSILRAKRLSGWKFRRQQQIDCYIVDFICFERRLIIEADGSQHAEGADLVRDAYLAEQGFTMLRLWNNEILGNSEGCFTAIIAALENPSPQPSPARGEGESGANSG